MWTSFVLKFNGKCQCSKSYVNKSCVKDQRQVSNSTDAITQMNIKIRDRDRKKSLNFDI